MPGNRSSASDHPRGAYAYFLPLGTRWHDNDVYGHINNVVYYSYFDTTANHFLVHEAGLDIGNSPVIGIVVSSACEYFESAAYPQELECALRVGRLGNSSVTWELAVFRRGETEAIAAGHFTHVFVMRDEQRPTAIPASVREAMQRLQGYNDGAK